MGNTGITNNVMDPPDREGPSPVHVVKTRYHEAAKDELYLPGLAEHTSIACSKFQGNSPSPLLKRNSNNMEQKDHGELLSSDKTDNAWLNRFRLIDFKC